MDYLSEEIFKLFESNIEYAEPVIESMGIESSILKLPIDVNVDMEIILEANDLIKYNHDELETRMKTAYDEIFKEGIVFGIVAGKILKIDNCIKDENKYNEYLSRDFDSYTDFNLKIDFLKRTIPPIKIRKSTREKVPRQLNYENKKYEQERLLRAINVECKTSSDCIYGINDELIMFKNKIKDEGISDFLRIENTNGELKKYYENIDEKLFNKFFEVLGIELSNAKRACENYYRFDTKTAHDMFISNLFSTLEGEFEGRELVKHYIRNVFFKGVDIGMLCGKMFFVFDIQSGFLTYDEIKDMDSDYKTKYLVKELNELEAIV